MIIAILAVCAGLTLIAVYFRARRKLAREVCTLRIARKSGVRFHSDRNIHAADTLARMQQHEDETGKPFMGKQARFMELIRIVADGPMDTEELRFLIAEGIEPILRPDGLIYVPCIENQHLRMKGEAALTYSNLEQHLKDGSICWESQKAA